jgi:ABC-type dipeptide/oligopeptide/nickel transport system permease subunit
MMILLVVVLVALFADVLAPHDPEVAVKSATGRPVRSYLPPFWMKGGTLNTPLGTDFHSRDILSRLLYGARVSLLSGCSGRWRRGHLAPCWGLLLVI